MCDLSHDSQKSIAGEFVAHSKTRADLRFLARAFHAHAFFRQLSPETVASMIKAMSLYSFAAGSTVYSEGDRSNSIYVVNTGTLSYSATSGACGEYVPGTLFGETSFLCDTVREEEVLSHGESSVWRIRQEEYVTALSGTRSEQVNEYKIFLESVPLLSCFNDTQQYTIIELLAICSYANKEHIIQEGEVGDLFYIIKEGTVVCTKGTRELARLKKGDFFGEQALLYDIPRTATITALGAVQVLSIRRQPLATVLGKKVVNLLYKHTLWNAIDRVPCLELLLLGRKESAIKRMSVTSFTEATLVIPKGTAKGNQLWIVVKGIVRSNSKEYSVGTVIGAKALVFNKSGTVNKDYLATPNTDIAWISVDAIEQLLGWSIETAVEVNKVAQILASVKLLNSLSINRIQTIASKMNICTYSAGEIIFHDGDTGSELFIIKSGSVSIIKNEKTLRSLEAFNFFGERAILLQETRTASVKAETEVVCWALNKETFLETISPGVYKQLHTRILLQDDTIAFKDLRIIKPLGNGNYGNIFLVTNARNRSLYALKAISKQKASALGTYKNLMTEKQLLMQLDHPMIIKMVKTFRDELHVYTLLEYVAGQNFRGLMRALPPCSMEHARFYTSCFVLVLEYLHNHSILQRDFKPDNFIIDESGYPKLIDFAVSKVTDGRTHTSIGTPHYMAPEVIGGMGYSWAADYWSLGVMLYELLSGTVPFGEGLEDPLKIYEAVMLGTFELNGPMRSNILKSLLLQLLNNDPKKRESSSSVKAQAFFRGVEWERLLSKTIKAPYRPAVTLLLGDLEELIASKQNIAQLIQKEELFDTYPYCVPSLEWSKEF